MANLSTTDILTGIYNWAMSKLNGKQSVLTFDNVPTANSNNPVKSGGIYTAISGFVTKSVSDLTNYYTKSEACTKAEVNDKLDSISEAELYTIFPPSGS